MFSRILSILLFILVASLSASPVFSGGGPIYFSIEPNAPLNPGEQYIVHAQVYADGPYPTYCKNCYIKLALKNPQESDYIAQSSDRTDEDGRIYAKVISKIAGERIAYASELIRSNGEKIVSNSSIILKYRGNGQLDNPNGAYIDPGSTSVRPPESIKVTPDRLPVVPVVDTSQFSSLTISPSSTPATDTQNGNLGEKVNQIEKQLEGIRSRQAYLEKLVADLASLIRSFLPFR